jgi:hypothetical protein
MRNVPKTTRRDLCGGCGETRIPTATLGSKGVLQILDKFMKLA